MKLRLAEIREVAMKHPGMWDDFMRAGRVSGVDLELERPAFETIEKKYFGEKPMGLMLHAVLEPVARVLDAVLGTELADCGPCAERELKVSEMGTEKKE